MVYNATKRDLSFPDIPILKELGCEDYPADGLMVAGSKGLPEPMVKKLKATFKQIAASQEFQKLPVQINLPYDYKDGIEIDKEAPAQFE